MSVYRKNQLTISKLCVWYQCRLYLESVVEL